MPAPPQRIGPYQVVRTLGSGGMGTVFEVRHPKFPRPLALKVINTRAASTKAVARFWREAEFLARIRHPGVVAIHQLGRSPQGPYIVEDMVDGQVLTGLAETGVDPRRAAELARDLASALEAVHAQGILHRDLKPGNVVIDAHGKPVLLDFGLAREVSNEEKEKLTQTGQVVGTPSYMSPEQARGLSPAKLGPQVDVYGLGAILFHLIAARKPFESASMLHAIAQVIQEEPRWPSQSGVAVSVNLEAIVRVAMAKDPAERYATMTELREDLERFLNGEPTRAAERLALVRGQERRGAALKVGAALVALVCLALGGWGLVVGLSPDAPPPHETGPVASQTPVAEAPKPEETPVGLWHLKAGDTLRFRTTYAEEDSMSRITLDVWFAAEVRELAEETRRLDTTVEAMVVSFGAAMVGMPANDQRYDSRDPPEEASFLDCIAKGVGQRLAFELDPLTGAVKDMQGVDAIGDAVLDAMPPPKPGDLTARNFEILVKRAFTDAFITRIMQILLHVGGGNELPWVEREGPGGSTYTLQAGGPQKKIIRNLLPATVMTNRAYRFALAGEALYSEGRLVRAHAEQEFLGKLVDGELKTTGLGSSQGIPLVSRQRWGFYLQREGDPLLGLYGE